MARGRRKTTAWVRCVCIRRWLPIPTERWAELFISSGYDWPSVPDNDVNLTHLLGLSGKITGPGSLSFGSPTATSRSGILSIGSVDGSTDIPNDYAGGTIINGINGGTISTTLRIFNSADNNIMPHGTTGNYSGGRTGNLIFNGVAGIGRRFLI